MVTEFVLMVSIVTKRFPPFSSYMLMVWDFVIFVLHIGEALCPLCQVRSSTISNRTAAWIDCGSAKTRTGRTNSRLSTSGSFL